MINLSKLKEEQEKLAKKVTTKDSFDKIETIAGVDQNFSGKNIISAIVVCNHKDLKVIEKKYVVVKVKFPYIPGFLAYREGPAITEAFSKLDNKPDVLMVDGNGILHPSRIGLASHVGVLLDQCTIGISKSFLLGVTKGDEIYVENELRGMKIKTKEGSKPLFVSPGNKISLKTAVDIVKKCIKLPHKLPEPLHLAHRYADELRNNLNRE